ncbi:MAG: MarR family winged helix-turn-helix transcriptional regulator [Janthinobacterium lividum]
MTSPSRPAIDLYAYLPFGLIAVANRVSRSASRLYRERFGVGINAWRVLANVRATPGVTAQALCRQSGLDKGAVSRAVAALHAAGHLAGAGDSRNRPLHLSPAGDALHDRIIAVAFERERALLAGFDADERRVLLGFVARLNANAAAMMMADDD